MIKINSLQLLSLIFLSIVIIKLVVFTILKKHNNSNLKIGKKKRKSRGDNYERYKKILIVALIIAVILSILSFLPEDIFKKEPQPFNERYEGGYDPNTPPELIVPQDPELEDLTENLE